MFAVIKTGGKQYVVSEGEKIKVEKLTNKVGDTIDIEEVLLLSDKKGDVTLGTPYLKDVKVTVKVVEEGRGEKKIIFKHKPKKRYKLKKGHRQPFTEIEIKKIAVKKETESKETVKKTVSKKESKK